MSFSAFLHSRRADAKALVAELKKKYDSLESEKQRRKEQGKEKKQGINTVNLLIIDGR